MITYKLENSVATLTLDDTKANALGFAMMSAYIENMRRAQAEADIIVISGRPGMMSAGFDLKVMKNEPDRVAEMVRMGADLLVETLTCPKPVIIASTGHAMAAGALLMLTGDIRLGLAGNYFYGLNETAIGMVMPDFGMALAHYRLGEHHLDEAVLQARLYGPEDAQRIGYLDHVVDAEAWDMSLTKTIEDVKKLDLKAYRGTKRKIRQALADSILAGLDGADLNIAG